MEDEITALAFSPNGKLLALSHFRGAVQLWDTKTWKRQAILGMLGEQGQAAFGMTFTHQGDKLAVGNVDKHVRVWDLATRKEHILGALPLIPEYLAFSTTGAFLAVADFNRTVKVWDLRSGDEHWTFQAHTHPITKRTGIQGAAFHPGGSMLITAGTDGMVRIWDVPNKKEVRKFDGKVGEVNFMALSPDGAIVAVAGGSSWSPDKPGGVRFWETATGCQLAERGPLDKGVSCLCFSDDGKNIVVGTYGPEGKIHLWAVEDLICQGALKTRQ